MRLGGSWLVLLSALACSSDNRTVLIVYSPHGKELLAYSEKEFEKAHPGIDVQWVDMGSQEVLDRVRAERTTRREMSGSARRRKRLIARRVRTCSSPTSPAGLIPSAWKAVRMETHWYGTYLTPEVIAYNTEAVSAAAAPKDWDEVLDPKWKGKILIRDPIASGTMRAIFGAIVARAVARTGSPEAGYDWLRKLDANTREYVLNPTILYQKLGRQEGIITLWDMPDIATLQQRTGIPVGYVIRQAALRCWSMELPL